MTMMLRMAGTLGQRLEVDPALVGWWRFDGNLTDASGNGNTLAWSGADAYAQGKYGQSAGPFTDSNFISSSANLFGSFGSPSKFTVSFWVNTTSTDRQQFVGEYQISGNQRGWLFERNSGTHIQLIVSINGTQFQGTLFEYNLPTNKWVFLCVTYDGTGNLNFYADGLLIGTTPAPYETIHAGTESLFIGKSAHAPDRAVQGQIDNPMIYNRALTPSEIKYVYDTGRPVLK